MRRRFRRRPSLGALVAVALAFLVASRLAWDWLGRDDPTGRSAAAVRWTHQRPVLFASGPCTVLEVLPGNTLLVQQPRQVRERGPFLTLEGPVRLLGIRPPRNSSAATDESLAMAARRFTEDFVRPGSVVLQLDKRRIDEEGCFLAYIHLGGRTLNVELVRAGLALGDPRPGDSATLSRLIRKAEEEARWAGRGMWSKRDLPEHVAH